MEQLLPLAERNADGHRRARVGLHLRAGRETVVDELLVRYVEALVYQAVAENMASEQSARMVAMKAASDNADNVIGELQADLQQDAPGRDHQGIFGNRRPARRMRRSSEPTRRSSES